MKKPKIIILLLLLSLLLTACTAVTPTAVPTVTALPSATPTLTVTQALVWQTPTPAGGDVLPPAEPTATPLPSPTPPPTATSTPTLTPTPTPPPIPTLLPEQVGGLEGVPDPRVTAPGLFDLARSDAPIPQFVNAMRMGGIEVNPQNVADNLQYQAITGLDGKQYVVGYYNFDPDPNQTGETLEGPIPLMIWSEEGWRKITPKILANLRGANIGVMFGGWFLRDPDYMGKKYMSIPPREFNMIGPNDLLMQTGIENGTHDLRKGPEKFDFTIPDYSFKFLKQHQQEGLTLQWSAIIAGNGNLHIPNWLKDIKDKEEYMNAITHHLSTILTRYQGNNITYVLVNEYFGDPFTNDPSTMFWLLKNRNLGISDLEFMDFVFKTAKEADPTSRLVFNEYGLEIPDSYNYVQSKENKIYSLLKQCKENGVPIDGVGFQMHLYGRDFRDENRRALLLNNFRNQIRKYQSLGLQVNITELDVRIDDIPDLPLAERLRLQGLVYYLIIKTAIEEGITNINIWGVSDRDSWLNNPQLTGADSLETRPLLFDNNDDPKLAYYALIKALTDGVIEFFD